MIIGYIPWWRNQMETFFVLLAICAGNSPVTGEFPSQRPVTRSFDVFFDLCLNKRLSKHQWLDAGDWRRHRAHYAVTVMSSSDLQQFINTGISASFVEAASITFVVWKELANEILSLRTHFPPASTWYGHSHLFIFNWFSIPSYTKEAAKFAIRLTRHAMTTLWSSLSISYDFQEKYLSNKNCFCTTR